MRLLICSSQARARFRPGRGTSSSSPGFTFASSESEWLRAPQPPLRDGTKALSSKPCGRQSIPPGSSVARRGSRSSALPQACTGTASESGGFGCSPARWLSTTGHWTSSMCDGIPLWRATSAMPGSTAGIPIFRRRRRNSHSVSRLHFGGLSLSICRSACALRCPRRC